MKQRHLGWVRLGALAAGMLLAATAAAQNRPAAAAAPATTTSAAAPAVAEQVDRLLKEMGAYIGSAEQFTFHADVTFDHVLPSGQKLEFAAAEEVVLHRPGRLYVEWNGDLGARQFWYDGKSVTLYDPATPFYSSEAAPSEIDSMLAQLVPKLDFAPPLADFLYKDPDRKREPGIRVRSGPERCEWQDLPDPCLCREGRRLADLDRERAAADPVQAGHHL